MKLTCRVMTDAGVSSERSHGQTVVQRQSWQWKEQGELSVRWSVGTSWCCLSASTALQWNCYQRVCCSLLWHSLCECVHSVNYVIIFATRKLKEWRQGTVAFFGGWASRKLWTEKKCRNVFVTSSIKLDQFWWNLVHGILNKFVFHLTYIVSLWCCHVKLKVATLSDKVYEHYVYMLVLKHHREGHWP